MGTEATASKIGHRLPMALVTEWMHGHIASRPYRILYVSVYQRTPNARLIAARCRTYWIALVAIRECTALT